MIKSDKNRTLYLLLHFFCFALILRVKEDPETTLNRIMENVSFWPFNCKAKKPKMEGKSRWTKASKKRPFFDNNIPERISPRLYLIGQQIKTASRSHQKVGKRRESKNKPSKEIPVDLLKPSQELYVNFFHDKILLSAVLFLIIQEQAWGQAAVINYDNYGEYIAIRHVETL